MFIQYSTNKTKLIYSCKLYISMEYFVQRKLKDRMTTQGKLGGCFIFANLTSAIEFCQRKLVE